MKNYLTKLAPYETVVIMGYADLGQYLYSEIKSTYPEKKIAVCDNALSQQGRQTGGGIIISPAEAVSLYPQAVYIPTSIHRRDMMCKQLISLGVPSENILISEDIFQDEKSRLHNFVLTAKDKLFFEVDLARHCNLNCRGCLHYSPLTEPQFLNIEIFHKDIKRIHEIFGQNVARVMFIGGEPLLCPNIADFIKLTRRYFLDSVILIITNGTLTHKMSEEFWKICKECDVTFYLSQYPINIDYFEINNFILEKGIKSEMAPLFNGRFFVWPFDFSGNQNPKESFINCLSANKCITLRDGKLLIHSTNFLKQICCRQTKILLTSIKRIQQRKF